MEFKQENLYVGSQVIVESDRLNFNGREDVIFSANNLFLFKNEGEFHINTAEKTIIASPQVYLGNVRDGQIPNIAAVKSDELIRVLNDIISALVQFSINYGIGTSGGPPGGPNPAVNQPIGNSLKIRLEEIQQRIDDIKSDVVYLR